MNKRKLLLLRYFLNNCDNGYRVIDVSKIFLEVKKYKGDYTQLEEDVNFLKTYKYIDVKYMDNANICLCVLDDSKIFQENLKVSRTQHIGQVTAIFLTAILSGVMAFLGGFLAVILFG